MQQDAERIVIRRGTAADAEALVKLIGALADYEKLPPPSRRRWPG